jgi:hypothetical protein
LEAVSAPPETDVFALLCAIEALLTRCSPRLVLGARLRPPASAAVRRGIARGVGLEQLPADLDAVFRWHDGQDVMPDGMRRDPESLLAAAADFGGWLYVSTDEILRCFERRTGLCHWKMSYVPVFSDGGGNYVVFDTKTGSIDSWDHECEPPFSYPCSLEEMLQGHLVSWRNWCATRS